MWYKSIYNRLRRVEGTIRGIEEMLAKEKPEREIIIQLEAAKSALASTIVTMARQMMENRKRTKDLSDEDFQLLLRLISKN